MQIQLVNVKKDPHTGCDKAPELLSLRSSSLLVSVLTNWQISQALAELSAGKNGTTSLLQSRLACLRFSVD